MKKAIYLIMISCFCGINFVFSQTIPTVTTSLVTNITNTSASGGGSVTASGGATVTVRGVCWSMSAYPDITDDTTSDGTGTGTFTSSITGLTPSTTYYVRAYATNSNGTAYGLPKSFTTTGDTVGINTILINSNLKNLYIYPNPIDNNQANVIYYSDDFYSVTIKLIDATGRILSSDDFDVTTGLNNYTINLNNINNGLYIVELINGNVKTTTKLIINK